MVGSGEAYFAAFALAIGLGQVTAGLVASLPMLAGSLLQLASPFAVRWLGSTRRWVVGCAFAQSLSFAPLIVGAATGELPAWGLFAAVALYWGSGMATGPAWSAWITTIVPPRLRAHYFARRSRRAQFGVVGGLVGTGLLLQWQAESLGPLAYAIPFGAAGLARLISGFCLVRQSEPEPVPREASGAGFGERARRLMRGPGGRVLSYMLALQIAVQISGPFFAPYMLSGLNLTYAQFMMLIGAAYTGRVLSLPWIGRFARRFGPANLLWVGGAGIAPLTAMWMATDSFWILLAFQLFSGSMWACYEMATMLLTFETIPASERTGALTIFNLANAIAIVVGSTIGGTILGSMGATVEAYHVLFAVSLGARFLALPLVARVKAPPRLRVRLIPLRTVALRPSSGGFDRPVLPGIEDEERNADEAREPPEDCADEDAVGSGVTAVRSA
jgi:MFS family permease